MSFPGGRIDVTDPSPEAAALREAAEEIGLDPADVELLGRLPDYVTGTGYRITPVVGLLPTEVTAALRPSASEVAAVFGLPLTVLLDPAAPRRQRAEIAGGRASSGSGRIPSTTSGVRPPASWSISPRACAGTADALVGAGLFLSPFALYVAWRLAAIRAQPLAGVWARAAAVAVLAASDALARAHPAAGARRAYMCRRRSRTAGSCPGTRADSAAVTPRRPRCVIAPPAFLARARRSPRCWRRCHEARLVGGAVRDALAGARVADVDLATPDPPETVSGGAAQRRAEGSADRHRAWHDHGRCRHRGFEVTTLRRDVATDGRRAVVAYHRGLARGRGAAGFFHQRACR